MFLGRQVVLPLSIFSICALNLYNNFHYSTCSNDGAGSKPVSSLIAGVVQLGSPVGA